MRLIWKRLKSWRKPAQPETAPEIDSRYCGLHDAVLSGWFNNSNGELHPGFAVGLQDIVVDFGCGSGGATQFCARQGARVTFIDSDESKIAQIEQGLHEAGNSKGQGLVHATLPLPLDEGCASRVIAQEVLEHVDAPEETLAELYRIGQPGALYLLSVPHQRSEQMQKDIAPSGHFAPPNHQHIFSEDAFAELVSQSGLEIISRHNFGFYWSFWMQLYWATQHAEGKPFSGATHDLIAPPYPALLSDWASVWQRLLQLPLGPEIKHRLDQLLPKCQIIVARKPSIGQ